MDNSLKTLLRSVRFSGIFVIAIWVVHIYKYASENSLTRFGVYPREWDGIIGIFTSPFIHGSWEHLISNSVPLFVTLTIIHYFYKRVALSSVILVYLLTGSAVWMFGRSVYHIGASGVVYGLISFIFWSGVFRRNIKSIVLALIVTILYAGYLEGIVPFKEGVSWESHLLGVFAGIIVSFFLKEIIERDEVPVDPWANESNEPTAFFFPRDVFEMTRAERFDFDRQVEDE